MAGSLSLIANPGSASRKYALYEGENERAQLHFEWWQGKVICTMHRKGSQHLLHIDLRDLGAAASQVIPLLHANNVLQEQEEIDRIGLRIVAPSAYFLEDRIIDDTVIASLEAIKQRAPIHIAATLEELHALRKQFKDVLIIGVSDSGFHRTKPDYAWNYGISLEVADRYEIKRFGYHGLSVASVVNELRAVGKLSPKLIVCHLGSGASVTALHGGKSLDTTMGYSPLEGIVMSTRSGDIDPTAVRALKDVCRLDDDGIEDYLNNHSGLLGLGGSSDIRELLRRESDGDNRARLALATYVYSVQKAVGQMTAALGGVDALVFTGTVGERSAAVRARVTTRLHYLDFVLDGQTNQACESPEKVTVISRLAHSKPVYVLPANESGEMVQRISQTMLG
ncbi:MAG: hypothetical protein ABWY71_03020 [Candidatus Saccharimonadales bacterium]